jgi:hypothetical protein
MIKKEDPFNKLKLTPKQADNAHDNKAKVVRYDSEVDDLGGYEDAPRSI